MSIPGKRVLTSEQMAGYEELGFVHSVPILTPEEVRYYRDHVEKTWSALGGRVTRADGLHLFFRWAWDLATHPRLLDCLEDLLGPVILLRHTRIFYKYGQSAARVNWHQDGYTENLSDAQVPAIWLGLTDATVENGCLQVVPRSHRLGMQSHWSRQTHNDLASSSMSDREPGSAAGDDHDLSGKPAKLPEGLGCTFRRCDEGGGDEFPPPSRSARLKSERVRGAPDRAVGNVFHAWASQERHRPRLGAGKCRPAARVPAFEQAGGSPA